MPHENQFLRWLIYALAAAVLFASFKTVFALTTPDPDSLLSLTLWAGFKSGGLAWIWHFKSTPDNWLLSIIPFNFLSFALFGPSAFLAILSGWLVYVLSACTAGAIALTLGARRAAFALPIILLCLGHYAQICGYVAYPTSHGVTNLYGLATILCTLRAFKTGNSLYFAVAFLLALIATLSDPWMLVAYDLPVSLVLAVILLRKIPRRRLVFAAIFFALALIVLLHQKLIDHLQKIPGKIATLSTLRINLEFIMRDLGGLLNLLPWNHSNNLAPAIISISLWTVAAILVVSGLRKTVIANPHESGGKQSIFLAIAACSSAATLAITLFINVPATSLSARFILNAFYLFAILLATIIDLTWNNLPRLQKSFISAIITLFIAAGLAPANSQSSGEPALPLITFLSQNKLSYGYGPYWGAQANAVTALTAGAITIRPVMFSPLTGEITPQIRDQSSPAWYLPADFPARTPNFFVLITPDGEQCPNPALCAQGVVAQLGPPLRTLHHGAATILVFERSKQALLF